MSSSSNEFYRFTFGANGAVTSMAEVKGNKLKAKNIVNTSFETTGALGGITAVESSKLSMDGKREFTLYEDGKLDGLFREIQEVEVATFNSSRLDKYKFSFDGAGNVTAQYEQKKGGWKLDRLDGDESLDTVVIAGESYVVKTEDEWNGAEISLYRDDNGDGVWTEVLEAEAQFGSALLDAHGAISLTGLADYLALTSTVVG